MTIRRANDFEQERIVFCFEQPQLTAGYGVSCFSPTRKFRVDSVKYNNPTGLVANATNWFTIDLRRVSIIEAYTAATQAFTGEADDDLLTITAHGFQTGDGPLFVATDDTLPEGLVADTGYWAIRVSANTLKLASSRALAYVGTGINLTSDGTGNHTISTSADTRRPAAIVSAIDTDSDNGQGSLVPDAWVDLDLDANESLRILESGDELLFVATEGGNATLPAGRLVVEGRYL